MNNSPSLPIAMSFAGMDPSGGAGLQADIETLASMGVHSTPVVTAITVQDTQTLLRYEAVDTPLLVEQARAILEDMPVAAIKIGMIGSVENVEAIHTILMDYPSLPVVLDPLVNAGGGGDLADDEMLERHRAFVEHGVVTGGVEPWDVEGRLGGADALGPLPVVEAGGGVSAVRIAALDDQPRIEFRKTKDESERKAAAFKVSLGVMPDYTYDGEGMRVDAVIDGRPGAKAGMQAGDIIVRIGEVEVHNIYDYMEGLSKYGKGDSAPIVVLRDGQKITLQATFE